MGNGEQVRLLAEVRQRMREASEEAEETFVEAMKRVSDLIDQYLALERDGQDSGED